jgi:hypothetical protein
VKYALPAIAAWVLDFLGPLAVAEAGLHRFLGPDPIANGVRDRVVPGHARGGRPFAGERHGGLAERDARDCGSAQKPQLFESTR